MGKPFGAASFICSHVYAKLSISLSGANNNSRAIIVGSKCFNRNRSKQSLVRNGVSPAPEFYRKARLLLLSLLPIANCQL